MIAYFLKEGKKWGKLSYCSSRYSRWNIWRESFTISKCYRHKNPILSLDWRSSASTRRLCNLTKIITSISKSYLYVSILSKCTWTTWTSGIWYNSSCWSFIWIDINFTILVWPCSKHLWPHISVTRSVIYLKFWLSNRTIKSIECLSCIFSTIKSFICSWSTGRCVLC